MCAEDYGLSITIEELNGFPEGKEFLDTHFVTYVKAFGECMLRHKNKRIENTGSEPMKIG